MVPEHLSARPGSGRVTLRLQPEAVQVAPGSRARLRLRIANPTPDPQDVAILGDRLLDGWSLSPKVHSLTIPAYGATVVILRLDVPDDAWPGQRVPFQLRVLGSRRPDRAATCFGEAMVAVGAGAPRGLARALGA